MQSNPLFAKRAAGAMFLSFFGTAWALWWALHAASDNVLRCAMVLCLGGALFGRAWTVYCAHRDALAADDAAKRQTDRRFRQINTAEWLLIIVSANVLINLGKPEWVVVSIMFIVGLHFIPLAFLFRHKAHHILGVALMGWALLYPALLTHGPADVLGCLGAGLILWTSALHSLRGTWGTKTPDRLPV